ncbi:MAG TPA: efflux RND transporter periplasmic adaptor subunit [Longimicrobium sp.]
MLLLFALSRLTPPRVATVGLERREVVQTLVVAARVEPASRARLGSGVAGTVNRVTVREGDRVAAGQVLLTLDEGELQAAALQAGAAVREAQAALARIAGLRLPAATAALDEAEAEMERAERDLRRAQSLLAAGALSRRDVERAASAAGAARSTLADARALRSGLARSGAEHRQAEAQVEQTRQAYAGALARLRASRVIAPGEGVVLVRRVEPGDAVLPGQVLLEMARDGSSELVAFPDERNLSRLRVGQPARASADAYPDSSFGATVGRIFPVVDVQQGTIELRLSVAAPPAYLVPDMTVSVEIELGRRTGAPTLPLDAVRAPVSDTAWVLVARGGRAVRLPVRLGVRDGQRVEVLGGVTAGDRVLGADAARIRPGDRVRTGTAR